jgi:hypothetical protein
MRGLSSFLAARAGTEDGAVLVLVVLSLTVILGATMLAVDSGGVWVARRTLVAGTEAAALAGAQAWAKGADGCADAQLATLVTSNAPGATFECSTGTLGATDGYVTINSTSAPVTKTFGRAIGPSTAHVEASASARWGMPMTIEGSRPLALCIEVFDASPGVHRIDYKFEKEESESNTCGDMPGAWGFTDPDGGAASDAELTSRLRTGYLPAIAADDCDADGTAGDRCPGDDSWSSSQVGSALTELKNADEPIVIALVDDATIDGFGRTQYRVAGFAGAVVDAFRVSGRPKDRHLDLEFVPVVGQGRCCAASGVDAGVRVVRLCGTDGGPAAQGARCDA